MGSVSRVTAGSASLLVLVLARNACVHANLYDVIQPHLTPPEGGCKAWADAPEMDQYWVEGKPPVNAGSFCAQQGKGNPAADFLGWKPDMGAGLQGHSLGCYCVSKTTNNISICTSAKAVPEQVNVQIASGDAVVVGFVTYEDADPTAPPVVELNGTAITGVTHKHNPCSVGTACTGGPYKPRTYYMHFVRLADLSPRATYIYKAKSGSPNAAWSDTFSFRAPYTEGVTKIALYGDMGVYTWNNMANLYEETVENKTADLILHAGDHCYNEGDDDERRADGYMQAFEKTIANAPWMPIVGNHEFYAGTNLTRYLDSTWEEWGPIDGGNEWGHPEEGLGGQSTATSALGAFLSAGNHHGPGVHAAVPSKTSRYFSVDFGLTHLVALSLNGYNKVDLCTDECNTAQLAWLKQDLAAVNRTKTPWVIAMSHFPMYLTVPEFGSDAKPDPEGTGKFADEAWYNAEQCEYEGHNLNCTVPGWKQERARLNHKQAEAHPHSAEQAHSAEHTPSTANANADLEPIFYEYGVDIYWAGHIHFYNRFDGPVWKGKVVSKGTNNPLGTIHSCTGNGGPPSAMGCHCESKKECVLCIEKPYSYTRLTAFNASDLLWEQVSNADNTIIDTWAVHQDKHGQFPTPAW